MIPIRDILSIWDREPIYYSTISLDQSNEQGTRRRRARVHICFLKEKALFRQLVMALQDNIRASLIITTAASLEELQAKVDLVRAQLVASQSSGKGIATSMDETVGMREN